LGILSDQNRVVVPLTNVSMAMQNAVIAIEDRRFYTNDGVDVRGIARAFLADLVSGRTVQGGSTITQQFVKNRLDAQADRTVFQKLREAALAFHLSRQWSKQKVLSQYLNSIYFGNGAYGVESAARTYFGHEPGHEGCGDVQRRPCAAELRPHEAALLAGLIASPTAFDPVTHPAAAIGRRNLVLRKMLEQHKISLAEYRTDTLARLPADVEPTRERAPGRDHTLDGLAVTQARLRRAQLAGEVRRQQLRGRLRGGDDPGPRAGHVGQQRVRRRRYQGRHAQDRPPRTPDGHPHAGLA